MDCEEFRFLKQKLSKTVRILIKIYIHSQSWCIYLLIPCRICVISQFQFHQKIHFHRKFFCLSTFLSSFYRFCFIWCRCVYFLRCTYWKSKPQFHWIVLPFWVRCANFKPISIYIGKIKRSTCTYTWEC